MGAGERSIVMTMTPGLDTVTVHAIEATGHHGVFAHERRDGQLFRCDVTLHLDTRRAHARDDLAEAVDYGGVGRVVHDILAGPPKDLVETVAGDIAAAVLADERVAAVDVTLHKPQAPMPVPFGDVTVTVHRTRADLLVGAVPAGPVAAAVAMGSNLGDRAGMLLGAVHALARTPGIDVHAVSPVVETDPVGGPGGQDPFLNAVVLVRTTLAPLALLHACQDVEALHGRRREVRWGPRTLDVDVLAHGDLVVDTPTLTLPHPRAAERAFVLVPWHLADSGAVLPDLYGPRPVADLVERLRGPAGGVAGVHVREDLVIGPGPGAAAAVAASPGAG
jgi:dihydroneopterin aldolase/2-amino-4-hydroxy-6-hydroxymethyldihydropteridine diphosphokinase